MLTVVNCCLFQGVLPWQYLKLSHWEIAELMYANYRKLSPVSACVTMAISQPVSLGDCGTDVC